MADLFSKDHQVSISCPWSPKPIVVKLSFTPPLTTTWRLHTVLHRKFLQINVTGQCEKDLYVEKSQLFVGDICNLSERHSNSSQVSRLVCQIYILSCVLLTSGLFVYSQITVSFIFDIKCILI